MATLLPYLQQSITFVFTISIHPAKISAVYLIAVCTVSLSFRWVGLVQGSPSASKSYVAQW